MESVAVITPTVGRLPLLQRCLASVSAQQYQGEIEHVVVGDHLPPAIAASTDEICRQFGARFVNDNRPIQTRYQPVRTGRLRNLGIELSQAPLVAHLDDDNTFEPEHVSTLTALLQAHPESDIAYCWRRMRHQDGREAPLSSYPWVLNHRPEIAREVFLMLAEEGFFTDGSAVIRDRIPDAHGDLCHIDSSEWLMRRSVFDRVRFREQVTPREMIYQFSEDYLFCREAWEMGIRFECSERVTLNYFLGGYSGAQN
ncbi:glycosyltransferase family A protein [Paludibacterium purpuratum]|uniref:Glycosyltransferase involved in cell wall biosynthesis n=1 Tax=Paludibacterium purpuratum TaxID=1144873 RepID=A0A4V3DUM5_9NEIS|nr:glycosyltransferase family A protein [Paludibacterium purpuratum]TDR73900.1 glycosyltransferase involved in cell wall biosynthesis [Paludibacterium purpuratum]